MLKIALSLGLLVAIASPAFADENEGRILAFGANFGLGIFTGGLGKTISPGVTGGLTVDGYVAKSFAIEAGIQYGNYLDSVVSGANRVDINTDLIPITVGLRYDFLAGSMFRPFVVGGSGLYIRTQSVVDGSQTGSYKTVTASRGTTHDFGGYLGAGLEVFPFPRVLSFALDFKYHFIAFEDGDDTFGGTLASGARSGGLFTPSLSLRLSM